MNHPQVPGEAPCNGCGRPFCGACLIELGGQRVCGWCRDARLSQLEARKPTDAAAVVLWARIYSGACAVMGSGLCAFIGLIYLIPQFTLRGSASPNAVSGTTFTGVLAVIFFSLALVALCVYVPPTLMLRPGRGWTWTWTFAALVLAILGGVLTITSFGIVLLGGGVPLMIFWVRPEVRAYLEERPV